MGRNGTGKTTLSAPYRGSDHPDDGSISYPKNATDWAPHRKRRRAARRACLRRCLQPTIELAALLAEAETAEDAHRIAEIHTRLGTSMPIQRPRARRAFFRAWLRRGSAGPSVRGVFGRMAHARGLSGRLCSPRRIFFFSTSRRTISISKARFGLKTSSGVIRTPY